MRTFTEPPYQASNPLERISSDAFPPRRASAACASQVSAKLTRILPEHSPAATPSFEVVAFLDGGTVDKVILAGIHFLRFLSRI